MDYPWYELLPVAHLTLEQGDFIADCPVIIPPQQLKPNGEYLPVVAEYDVVIISQSCDLMHAGKIDNVLVCPYYAFKEYAKALADKRTETLSAKNIQRYFTELRQGHQPNYHLLDIPPTPFAPADYLVVDFRNVYAVHISFLQQYVATLPERVRLLPPYKEHLSQAFARFFMRVGLPHDLPALSTEQVQTYTN